MYYEKFPLWLSVLRTHVLYVRIWVLSLALFSGLRIWCCHKLCCGSQIQPGPCIAVAVTQASSCSFDLPHSLGTFICRRCGCKKKKIVLLCCRTQPPLTPDKACSVLSAENLTCECHSDALRKVHDHPILQLRKMRFRSSCRGAVVNESD